MPTQLIVKKIDHADEAIILYGHHVWEDYHVLAPKEAQIQVDDVVEYESFGFNRGTYTRTVSKIEEIVIEDYVPRKGSDAYGFPINDYEDQALPL